MKKKMLALALLVLGLPIIDGSANELSQRRPHCGCPCCCPPPLPAPRQDRQRPPQGPPPSFVNEDLIEALSLTDEQVQKIKDMESSFQKQMEEMRTKDAKSKKQKNKDRKKEMDALMEAQQDRLKSILSDDQYKLFQEYMENNRPEGPRGPGGPEDEFGSRSDEFF